MSDEWCIDPKLTWLSCIPSCKSAPLVVCLPCSSNTCLLALTALPNQLLQSVAPPARFRTQLQHLPSCRARNPLPPSARGTHMCERVVDACWGPLFRLLLGKSQWASVAALAAFQSRQGFPSRRDEPDRRIVYIIILCWFGFNLLGISCRCLPSSGALCTSTPAAHSQQRGLSFGPRSNSISPCTQPLGTCFWHA